MDWPELAPRSANDAALMQQRTENVIFLLARSLPFHGPVRIRFAKDVSGIGILETPRGHMAMVRLGLDGVPHFATMTKRMEQEVRLHLAEWYPDDELWPVERM